MKKLVLGTLALPIVLAAIAVLVLSIKPPAMRPAPSIQIDATPEVLARGEYLVHHVAECGGCHSDHLWERFGMPIKPGTFMQGGFTFDEKFAVPGTVSAQNLTPDPETGKANWTDGELLRAIREGVSKDGHALFPMMPYRDLKHMSDADAQAIVAYLRTIPPVKNVIPDTNIAFPFSLLIKLEPAPLDGPVTAPTEGLAYGKYLALIGGCLECHTAHDATGNRVPGRDFAGGWEMRGPWGRNITSNITPHPSTYVGQATKAEFIGRFKSFATMTATTAPVASPGRNTVMPWLAFSGMTEADLGAIFDYLETVTPIENDVNAFPDAPES